MATKKKPSALLASFDDLDKAGIGVGFAPLPATVEAPTMPEKEERTWGEVASDVGISALKGAIAVPEAAVGLADMVSGGRVGKFLENEGGAVGFRPKQAKEMLDEHYSDEQKQAFQEVQGAEGLGNTFKAALTNPSVVGHTIVESLPSMAAGGVLARGALKLAPGVGGVTAAAAGEGVVGAGAAAEQIRQQTEDGLLTGTQSGLAAATGALTAGFSLLGGKIAQKLGIADVDTMLAGAASNPAAGKSVTRMVLEGALSEGLLEELPQSVSETVMQNLALERPLEEGVNQAIVLGLLSGAAMGGGVNLVKGMTGGEPAPVAPPPPSGPLGRAAVKAPPAVVPAAPAPLPQPEPATAQALLDHANQRAAEIDAKAKGTKEQKTKDADGKEVVTPAVKPQFLTPEEKEEQKFLKEHGGDAARLAQVYPEVAPKGASITGTDLADMLAPAENPLVSNGRAIVADRESETRTNNVLARMERNAGRELAAMREFDPAREPTEAAAEPDTFQPGDILNPKGAPFKNKLAANNAQRKHGGTVLPVSGGFVVRPSAPVTQEPASATPENAPGIAAIEAADPAAAPAVGADAGAAGAAAGAGAAVQNGQPEQPEALTEPASEWQAFGPETQTLNIPRAEMPQIKGEHRGAMVNFLKARGIEHEADEVDPKTLKPTQAEFSTAKVQKAREFADADRSILVSADGHVVDGHHQWLARGVDGNPVKVIRLKAPIAELLPLVREFPSSTVSDGATPAQAAAPTPAEPAPKKLPMVSKADADHLFGVDKKRQSAIDRVAKGTAYFSTAEKAGEFIKKSAIGETHEFHEPKPGRFVVRAKSPGAPPAVDPRPVAREQAVAYIKWWRTQHADAVDPERLTAGTHDGQTFTVGAGGAPFTKAGEIMVDSSTRAQKFKLKDLWEEAAPTPVQAEQPADVSAPTIESAPAPAVSANTIFTEDAAEKARAVLKRKLGTLNSGIDPELLQAGLTLAGYHIEKGARTFAAFARAMVADLGAGVSPYLKSWYMGVKYDPRATAFEGMDDAATVEKADVDNLAQAADTGDEGNADAAQQLDRAGARALEGAPAQDVRQPDEGGETGAGADRGGRGDGGGDSRADDAGGIAGRGVGSDPGALPVPAGGTRADAQDAKKRRVSRAARTEQGDGLFGPAGGLTPDTGANPAPNAPAIAAPQPSSEDFTITDELALGEGGQKTKFKNNVAAIRLVRELETSGRLATPAEQSVLAKYVGWGGLPQAFDAKNADWAREFAEISELMSPEELAAARQSTRYAHYTSREIIQDGIYAALRHFGFTGGKTLEAGAGVGNFIGLMPADMRSAGRFTAVEREPFSAAIARNLYPQQNVQRADFTEFKGNDAYFDAAVGNPPFASDTQTDASGRKHLSGLSLHNYFFAKSIDMLREGGILAQVVTNAFMDSKGNRARKYISDRVEFLGAIRLPNNAFAKNANTEVTTDLIFLKKRPDSEIGGKAAREDAKRWLDIGQHRDRNGKAVALNQYFIDNPSMMLGEFGAHGTMYRGDMPALVAREGQDTAALLREAVGKLPAGVYKSIAETGTDSLVDAAVVALKNPTVREGGYFIEADKLMQRLPDIGGEARGREIKPTMMWTAKTALGEQGFERIKALASMRSTVRGLIAAEMSDDAAAMKALRATLNEQYDAYAAEHGLINDPGTLRVFDDDPDFPLLASLEHGYTPAIGPVAAKRMGIKPSKSSAKKGPIFSQRVVAARQAVQKVETPADALAVSMAERGRLDAAYIGQLLGMDPSEVLRELSTGEKPLLFRDPATDEYVLRDAYLSGNVRAKLAQAKEAGMFTNITALEAVQPPDVGSHEIVARLGSPWVPTSVYRDFAQSLFGEESRASVNYLKANSSYQLSVLGGSDIALTNTWGTKDYHGDALLQAVMNNRSIKVTYRTQDGKTHTDIDATEKANAKAQELRDKFSDWLFTDPERSELLTKAYNETNNNYVTRVYDGSHMTFPGKVPDSVIKFRRHQRNAIARGVYDRTALLDHVVGAGKTFTAVATAMEQKRTGLARKPMVAVPNHLVKQWAADFYRLYPGANILTATKKDFEKANRRKFLARIATGDWDAVVIAHSSFGFIKPSPEFEAAFNGREVQKIMETITAVEEGDGDKQTKRRTVKQLEAMQERLENRIKSLRDKAMDDLLDFEQIGVDQLFVDEAHLFKNLMYTTKMQGVAGLNDPAGSQRAYDMYVKTNQIMEKNGRGQGVIFMTGTPVSNSLAEMYHMMRYLMPREMSALGFESFDAWANTFASVDQVWMQAPSGDGFKAQNRMSNFVNTPELLRMFDQVSDTVTMDDIKTAYREENDGAEFPLPKLKGGRRTPVSLEKSEAQNAYMADIAARAKAIELRKGPPKKGDDNILVVMGDARKAAMDIRLVDPEATVREPGGRIDRATDEVMARYKKFNAVKGTQIVFSDLGTPIKHAKKELADYEALQARILAGNEDVAASATLGNEAAIGIMEDAEAAQAELDAMGPDWLAAVRAALRGFSVYDDFKAALVEKGIPEAEIAFIHDYNTDDQKAGLFRKVNAGQVRVLMGSTAKLGAGTNVQERLVAEHHLDVPWRPSDVEQREGRIERQGNVLMTEWPDFEIEILAYVTRDTLDMRMWQVQETKLKMINQLRTRKVGREIDNAFEDMELSAGEMQAAATGDINLLKEIQLRNDVKKLEQKRRAFDGQKNDLISRKKRNADALRALPAQLEEAAAEASFAAGYFEEVRANRPAFKMNIDGKDYTDASEAQAVLRAKDEATEEHKALNGEVTTKKAPLSVTIDGELIKNRATMAELFSTARGDVDPIAWVYKGETYNRRTVAANGIRAKVLDAIADERVEQVGTLGPYSVAVEGSTDRHGNPMLEVTMRRDGDVKLSNSFNASDSNNAAARVIGLAENLLERAVSEAGYLDRQLKRAQREADDLAKVEVAGAWPEQAKLDAARAAHKAILDELKKKEGATPGAAAAPASEALSVDADGTAGDTEVHADATQAHRDAAAVIAARLTARRKASGGADVVLDAVAPGAGPRGRIANSVAAVARRLFAREVVYVRFEGKALFNGLVSSAYPGKIFLNIDAETPLMAVLGHELLHELRRATPGVYANLSTRLDRLIENESVHVTRITNAYTSQGLTIEGVDTREELEADIVGDNFMDPEFWKAMAEEQPGLFRRVVNAILKWLDMVAEKLGQQRPFGTEDYLADIAVARAAVADALRQFSAAEAGAVADPIEGDAPVARPGETLSIAADAPAPNDPRAAVAKAREVVTDLFNAPGKLNWWHKSVGTQYNLAQRSAPFKRVFDRVQDFINDVSYHATQAADLAPNILPKLDTWRDVFRSPVSAEDNKAIAAPIFEGTLAWRRDENGKPVKMTEAEAAAGDMTTEQKATALLRGGHITERMLKMWRGLPIEQYETIIENKFERELLAAGIVWSDAELVEHFALTPAQISLYREFRAATDKSLATLAISDMVRFGGHDVADVREAAMEAFDHHSAAVMLRDHLFELADAHPERREVLLDTANKMIEKADKVQSLMDHGYAPLSRFGHYSLDVVDAEGGRVYFGLFESKADAARMARSMRANYPDATIRQGTMSQEAYKLFAGVSPETLEIFGGMLGLESEGDSAKDRAFQEYLKLAKGNRSAMKRLIERKGVAGFSEDAGRVLAGFIYSNARQTATGLHMGAIAEAANDIPQGQGELKDAALKLMDYIKNPVEEAQAFRGLLFAQYLGGSLASAMVNMTQPVAVTMPYLSQFGGVRAAAGEMKSALADVFKKSTGNAELDAALKKAEEDGIVAPQEVHQLMAQSQGKSSLKSGDGTTMGDLRAKGSNALSKVSLAWGKAFGAAEQFNRRVTFIASFRLAKKQGIPDPAAFAEKTIAETQFIYNKGNKPRWARGAVGGTIFTFKQYSISYMELLTRMAAAGPEGKKAALMAVGILFLMGGAGGLPFVEDVEDVVDAVLQRMGYSFSTKQKRKEFLADVFGKEAAGFIEQGVSGLPGAPIDVSGRLGLGNLIPGTGLLLKKPDHSRDIVDAVGPAGDLIRRGFQSVNALASGQVGEAATVVSPVAVRNVVKAVDMANTGMYRDDRGRKVLDVDAYDAFAKAIGFQPNDVAQVQEGTFAAQKMISLNKITESEIAGRWAIGVFENDQKKVAAAREEMLDWNRKNPESPIRINMGQVLKRVRAMRQSKEARIAATAPREIRASVRRELAAEVEE